MTTLSAFCRMSDFKKLRVWRKAHALTLNVHRVAATIRGPQYAALRSQMTRAAMSVSANIVEGREQKSEREFARFLGYSLASTSELEHHLIVARDLRAISDATFSSPLGQLIDVRKMLHGLITALSDATSLSPNQPVPSSLAKSAERSAGSRRQRS
jgi:four helix bundle protein